MIRLENIHKEYKGVAVLKGVTLSVNQGDFVTLVGRIGCGKSTLLNIVAGLVKPDRGQMFYRQEEVSYKNRNYLRHIGFLLSGEYLFEDFSTIHYWKSICKLLNINSAEREKRIAYLIDRLRIQEPDKPIGKLSSGNRMLVKFGTMLLNNPQTLVIDEPFVHLDLTEIKAIESYLSDYHRDGDTVLLATHFPEPVYNIGGRLAILQDGVIKTLLSTEDYVDYQSFRINLGEYFNFSQLPPNK